MRGRVKEQSRMSVTARFAMKMFLGVRKTWCSVLELQLHLRLEVGSFHLISEERGEPGQIPQSTHHL